MNQGNGRKKTKRCPPTAKQEGTHSMRTDTMTEYTCKGAGASSA